MVRPVLFAICLVVGMAGVGSARVVDHNDVGSMASLPQSTTSAIGQQKWLFTHASVGGNMIDGMNDLRVADPNRYRLVPVSVGYNSAEQRANNPPMPTVAGRVYDCNRGNPGWQAKFTIFDNSVRISGWHDSGVDAVMDKLCYIDQSADPNQYVAKMAALELAYPQTVFVYTTMPLMTSQDYDNVLRNQYNASVRAYCAAQNRLLFDLADMEAHDPNGVQYTFVYGGQTYQKLYSGYSSDGGHLNTPGRQRVALGWYAVAAQIVEMKTFYSLMLNVVNGSWGSVTLDPEPNDANAPSYRAGTLITLTATPLEGKLFGHWEIFDPNHAGDSNFALLDTNNPLVVAMDSDRVVTAHFKCGNNTGLLPLLTLLLLTGVKITSRFRRSS
jgi:hypothetical protein